jgi:magnesium-transporting ATPase (P-type)
MTPGAPINLIVSQRAPTVSGLTSSEVALRTGAGQVNTVDDRTSRTTREILTANVFTRFNAIVTALLVVIIIFGEPADALFGFVMVCNSLIGIVQESRAKRTLDSLRTQIAPTTQVIRGGSTHTVASTAIVLDDIIRLNSGDQVPVDGTVLDSSGLELDESSLTGEAEPVARPVGDAVQSGSAVVAGTAVVVATAVGDNAWIHRLTSQARQFHPTESELRRGVDQLLSWIIWLIVPIAVLLFYTQIEAEESFEDGLVGAVSGVVAMVPQGLVLLVSVSMAVAVRRLAQQHVLTQELPAVEGLARIDVICLDKTGTLTTGKVELAAIETLGHDRPAVLKAIAALAASEETPSSTLRAIAAGLHPAEGWTCVAREPFSSARKWSAAAFDEQGTWVIGAPEVLLDATATHLDPDLRSRVADSARQGQRLLLVAHSAKALSGRGQLPAALSPAALVTLREQIRPDAADTIKYLTGQGVDIKIISGDNPLTVAAIAASVGVPNADRSLDLRDVNDVKSTAIRNVVFGRAQPEQKRELVAALQAAGHSVAMTGDGVNDIPALKLADIGIAMDTATPATKAVAQLVLLDGRFDRLPIVIAEGRRVIANMERVSALFLTKTIYAALLAVAVGVAGLTFPFLPRHLSLVGAATIGIPGFALSLWPSTERARPGYLHRTLRFAIPAGTTAAFVTFVVYATTRSSWIGASQAEARTAATATLAFVAFWILYRLIRPLDIAKATLIAACITGFIAVFLIQPLAEFYALEPPPVNVAAAIGAAVVINVVLLEAILNRMSYAKPQGKAVT